MCRASVLPFAWASLYTASQVRRFALARITQETASRPASVCEGLFFVRSIGWGWALRGRVSGALGGDVVTYGRLLGYAKYLSSNTACSLQPLCYGQKNWRLVAGRPRAKVL